VWGLVSCTAPRPAWAREVTPEINNTFAPSTRAAMIGLITLYRPGPVVTTTTVGRPVAKCDSIAANVAPASCRKWWNAIGLASRPAANGAMPPPSTPNACATPRPWRASARAREALGASGEAQRAPV
jgi:hypothetical protein